MAEYTVVAGPNGAGKSTFSKYLSPAGSIIFDPDHQKLKLEKLYPDIDEDVLDNAVISRYFELERKSMESGKSMAVETNLRNHFLSWRADFFKAAGYTTNLVFMLLPNVYASMDRVNLRVSKNGHDVDEMSIRHNFELGLMNLKTLAHKFDRVALLCAASTYGIILGPELLFAAKGKQQLYLNEQIPDWAISIVNQVRNNVMMSNEMGEAIGKNPGRKR